MRSPERIDGLGADALDRARDHLGRRQGVCVQFAEPGYTPALLREIDGLCEAHGELVEVRFYGHDAAGGVDLRTLDAIPNFVDLTVNCLRRATHVEALADLEHLRSVFVGIYELDAPDLLDLFDPAKIERLWLEDNSRRNVDLSRLAEFGRLREMLIEGHIRGIASVAEMGALEELWLRSIPKKQSLGFLAALPSMRFLQLILGGRESIEEVSSETLRTLQITRVRGFASFPDLSAFPALERLEIEDQARLESVRIRPEGHDHLGRLWFSNCKNLASLDGLQHLRRLGELGLGRTALDLDAVLTSPLPRTLRSLSWYEPSERRQREADALIREHGLEP